LVVLTLIVSQAKNHARFDYASTIYYNVAHAVTDPVDLARPGIPSMKNMKMFSTTIFMILCSLAIAFGQARDPKTGRFISKKMAAKQSFNAKHPRDAAGKFIKKPKMTSKSKMSYSFKKKGSMMKSHTMPMHGKMMMHSKMSSMKPKMKAKKPSMMSKMKTMLHKKKS
jgi:hypothetical protein